MSERERVEFLCEGVRCAGFLYRPPSLEPAPCVVMAHGFGGTQEGSLAANAQDFAAAGFVALTFDYRGFGESAGEPRQVIDIRGQNADWRAAIAFARTLPEVRPDRVALWGSSLGGGHVLAVAADDPTIAAVVAQVPFLVGFPSKVEGRRPVETRRLLRALLADWWAGKRGRPPVYIKAVGEPGELAVMASHDAAETVALMSNATWRNEVAPRALLDMALWYRPGRAARKLAMPVLFSMAEHDLIPADRTRPVVLATPRGELRAYPCNHFEVYSAAVRPTVVADQVSFLKTHLLGFEEL